MDLERTIDEITEASKETFERKHAVLSSVSLTAPRMRRWSASLRLISKSLNMPPVRPT